MNKEISVQRRYELDWLRVIAFGVLMLFHSAMMFTSFQWHVKNLESSQVMDEVIEFLHQWRMPLLFFISGAAVWFAMEKYSTWRYFRERQVRLLVPLIFGMLVVIPPQVYCERVYQQQGYRSFVEFYPTIFTTGTYPAGNLSWHHLWYVPYIWAFSMLTLPLFAAIRTNPGRRWLARVQRALASPVLLGLLFLPSALVEIGLRPYYPGDSCDLINDWANFTHKLSFFVAGFVLASAGLAAETLSRHRAKFLAGAVAALIVMELAWHGHLDLGSRTGPLYRLFSNFHIWMWLLAALGYGKRYLSFNHPWLKYATDAVYPFYILHQTVIVILALPLAFVDLPLWPKYLVVLAGMTLITWALYEGVIRRVNFLRVAFGLKPRRAPDRPAAQPESHAEPALATRGGAARFALFAGVSLLLVTASDLAVAANAGGRLVPVKFAAPALANNLLGIASNQVAAVYLPPGYAESGRRYPVIYFLPNFCTPIWQYTAGGLQGFRLPASADRLVATGRMAETIIVIPNVTHLLGGSWYRNSKLTGNWEGYITSDVVRMVDGRFRTIPERGARGLAGHGMGGTGALEIGLKHADVFGHVLAMSPGVFDSGGASGFAAEAVRACSGQRLAREQTGFLVEMQALLQSGDGSRRFSGLCISYLAAAAPDLSLPYPHIPLPPPGTEEADLAGAWAEIFGNWERKLASCAHNQAQPLSIMLECGRADENKWIPAGVEHLAGLAGRAGLPCTVRWNEGGHDRNLGARLEAVMLPELSRKLTSAR